MARFEHILAHWLPEHASSPAPLHRAMRYAVLGGGKRMRPRLVYAVASAVAGGSLDDETAELVERFAVAIEMIHAASLVHDDLPAFDDAQTRRGRPTVHRRFGEANAVLAGDALIVLAFEVLADPDAPNPACRMELLSLLARATGSREGIIGGQGVEELEVTHPEAVERYHALKTAALFRLAAHGAALAMGHDTPEAWADWGMRLGLAFQLADDLIDVGGAAAAAGKPVQQDAAHGRPNRASILGERAAHRKLGAMLDHAITQALALSAQPGPVLELVGTLCDGYARACGSAESKPDANANPDPLAQRQRSTPAPSPQSIDEMLHEPTSTSSSSMQ